MSLSCSCPDNDDAPWFFWPAEDFLLLETKRRKRCISCNKLIDLNSHCLIFPRFRYPQNDIELKIYNEDSELPLASYYMCEACGEQYLNLDAVGFCIDITDNMFDLLEEYHEAFVTPRDKYYIARKSGKRKTNNGLLNNDKEIT